MRLAVYTAALSLIFVPLVDATVPAYAQADLDCSRIITPEEKKKNSWTSFNDLSVKRIDLVKRELGVELDGKTYTMYFTDSTEVCNHGKHGTLRDLKVGNKINGFAKHVKGKAVVDIVAFNPKPAPIGIPVPGRKGWVSSPHAPSKPAINVSDLPADALVTCPYTGKVFRKP